MRAILWTKYGSPDGLQLREIEKPVPKENEIRIKIHATTVTAGDCETRSLKFPVWLALPMRLYIGFSRPSRVNILGQELAGEVEAVGAQVNTYQAGDQVFAALGFGMGAYAEYKCLPEKPNEMAGVLARKPSNLTYEQAAALPLGGLNALYFLRKGNIRPGDQVLINGAGGSIGTIAVQLARYYGAEVAAVDSTEKLEMLHSIGAQQVIDYTREDFTAGDRTYDVILDLVGKRSIAACLRSLKTGGRYLMAYPGISQRIRGSWAARQGDKQVIGGNASYRSQDLEFLKELAEAGKLQPVIDRSYPLEQVADAHRYVETEQKKGNVVIRITP